MAKEVRAGRAQSKKESFFLLGTLEMLIWGRVLAKFQEARVIA
jgi:hypothetical protein